MVQAHPHVILNVPEFQEVQKAFSLDLHDDLLTGSNRTEMELLEKLFRSLGPSKPAIELSEHQFRLFVGLLESKREKIDPIAEGVLNRITHPELRTQFENQSPNQRTFHVLLKSAT